MALRDAIQKVTTTHDYVDTYTGGLVDEQEGAYEIDGDFDTWHGVETNQGGSYSPCSATVSGTHTFGTPITLRRVTYRVSATASGANGSGTLYYIAYKVGSTWTDVPGSRSTTSGDSEETTYDFPTPVKDVTDVKIYTYAWGLNDEEGVATAVAHAYEIQAYYRIKKSYSGVI